MQRFRVLAALILGLAFSVRALYVVSAKVEMPIRGDVNQYVLYAWNLTHRGVFSTALPDASEAKPDSYRGPGYPFMLAAAMIAAGHSELPLREGPDGRFVLGYATDTWMRLAFAVQVVLGTATVWLAMIIARYWLRPGAALGVGLLLALWPHLVSFSGVLLSETLFAFMLVLSLWLLCMAQRLDRPAMMAIAGFSFGLTVLVNPLMLLFAPALAVVLAARSRRRLALVLLAGFALAPGAWAIRNTVSASGPGALQRIEENFVQGSWPQFLTALNTRFGNAISQQIVQAVDDEVKVMAGSWREGMAGIVDRMALDPAYYVAWYVVHKPYLLWDWSIRVGWGDIYFLPTTHSPFDTIPVLKVCADAYRLLNPLFFVLAAGAALWLVVASLAARRHFAFGATATVALVLYLTALHTVLQAEPRYSIPYRPEQVLLAVTAVSWLLDWAARRGHAGNKLDSVGSHAGSA